MGRDFPQEEWYLEYLRIQERAKYAAKKAKAEAKQSKKEAKKK